MGTMPHAKAATKLFNKIVSAAESEGVLTADGLAERLIVFGVPEHRSWRLFDLLDDDGDEEVALDEFVRGFAHYTALVNEFTAEDGGTTELDIHQLPQECMTIVLSCLSAQSPAELARVARASSRLRAAAAADGVWAPMFRRRAWVALVHCQLSTQLEQMEVGEADWSTVVRALPAAAQGQLLSRWRSWRECYRGALRQESWVVAELAASELRIGSVADPSPTVFPLPSPARGQWSRLASGSILADLICEALGSSTGLGPGISAEGASLCVVASPLDSPRMLTELASALVEHKVHRLQFINSPVAALECARPPPRVDDDLSQSAEPPPPSGVVVMISDEGCYAAAVANGRQLYIPTATPASAPQRQGVATSAGLLSKHKTDVVQRALAATTPTERQATLQAGAAAAAAVPSGRSFLPPIAALPVQEQRHFGPGVASPAQRAAPVRAGTAAGGTGPGGLGMVTAAVGRGRTAGREEAAAAAVPGTLSLYGCAALAQDLAVAIASAGQAAGVGSSSLGLSAGQQLLQAADVAYGVRSQLTAMCYVRACPAAARPVSEEERTLCRAAYEIQLTGAQQPAASNNSSVDSLAIAKVGGGSGQLRPNSPVANLQPMCAAAASSLVRQARLQQLQAAESGVSRSTTATASADSNSPAAAGSLSATATSATANGATTGGMMGSSGSNAKSRGIARFIGREDIRGLGGSSKRGGGGGTGSSILVAAVPPKASSPASGPQQQQQEEPGQEEARRQRPPSLVIELGEDRFALTEALLHGHSHSSRRHLITMNDNDPSSNMTQAAQMYQVGGATGIIGAVCTLAEDIFGAASGNGSNSRSLHSSDDLASLTSARQFVLAGEGALLQGLSSRLGWELRQRDSGRTTAIGRMLRGAKMVALTQPRPLPRAPQQPARQRDGSVQPAEGEASAAGGTAAAAAAAAAAAEEMPRPAAAKQDAPQHAQNRASLEAGLGRGTPEEARAVCWYGAKIHALRVERTGGFLKKGGSSSADAMRMASGRAWLTLSAGGPGVGGGGGGSRRQLKPNELAEQLKVHLRYRAGFPLPPSSYM
jgi:hypothetical protein